MSHRRRLAICLLAIGLGSACAEPANDSPPPAAATPEPPPGFAAEFAGPIEAAHARDTWVQREALASGIQVDFGGDTVLDGRIVFRTDTSASRIELEDGTILVWDGEQAWVSPADAEVEQARFHVLTWPYFASAPMKLRDPGANLESLGTMELRGEPCAAARLTFDEGVGDTPDDWYVVYRDPETSRLKALAYIVTFGKSREAAEEEPHAVTYHEHVDVDGVPIPTRWTFWLWSEERGIHGDPIGEVRLEDPGFVSPGPDAFSKPEDARAAPLPAAAGEDA